MPTDIVVVAFPGGQVLDVVGPAEVFSVASRLAGRDVYRVAITSPEGGRLATSGPAVLESIPLAETPDLIDTFIVTGGAGAVLASHDAAAVDAVRTVAHRARRVASVCTGAFVLAATGLLDGRRVTTHWGSSSALADRFPRLTVDPDPIFIEDGGVWTSAGVTAGIDLALEMVARDHGRELSAAVARQLVVFMHRPGGQAQFSVPLRAPIDADSLRELQAWMVEHPAEDLSVPALAARVNTSPRTLHRTIRRETGMTPAAWVEQLRVEAARRALETTPLSVTDIAHRSGLGTVSTMYRAFERRVGVTPAAYRRHFRAS